MTGYTAQQGRLSLLLRCGPKQWAAPDTISFERKSVMQTIMERAAKGHKKSMLSLYNMNKDKLYSFCCILLNDKQKAAFAAANIMNEVWSKLPSKNLTDEDEFLHLLFVEAAKHCLFLLFSKDSKGFKINKTTQIETVHMVNEDYMGSIPEGVAHLQSILETIDPHQRYIYLLHIAGGLDFKEIAHIIRQREAVAKYCFNLTALALSRTMTEKNGKSLRAGQIVSLLEQALDLEVLPESVSPTCLRQIKMCAKSPVPPKKILIPSLCAFLCIIGIITAVLLLSDNTEVSENDTSASNTSTETVDTSVISSPVIELDEELTYYADIEIADYGTITVELNQEAAPVTVANFINLAQNGFYDGLTFHRIIEGFMMQGGDPNGDGTGGNTDENGNEINIVGEFSDNGYENDLSHTRGAVSMARSNEYNSASSQFFIVQEDSSDSLDGQYAVFGYVTEGMDIVDAICESAVPTDGNGAIEADEQPVITSITIRTE